MRRSPAGWSYLLVAALLVVMLCAVPVSAGTKPHTKFSCTPRSGTAPLTVTFTDESTNSPTSWNWSFGDGNYSVLRDPTHAYSTAGTYTVTLNATNADGYEIETKTNYITVNAVPAAPVHKPVAKFSGTPASGLAPLTVTFTDESANSPTSWNWDFGDGNSSTEQNPVYAYPRTGTFSVSLTATNSIGSDTRTINRYISVMAASRNSNMNLNGTTIHTHGNKQNVIISLADVNGTVTRPDDNSIIIQNPGSGWSRMKLVSSVPVITEAGGLNVSELAGVVMTTSPVSAALNQTTLGTVTAQISIPMNQIPTGVSIEQNIYEGANESALSAFQIAATDNNLNITSVAYTVEIKNTAGINANLTGAGDPVRLNLSISHAFVTANGGIANIRIFRSAEDGTKQVLTTRFLFSDAATGMDFVEGDSPDGCSIFAIISVSGSAASSSSYSLSSSSDTGSGSGPGPVQAGSLQDSPNPGDGSWTTLQMSGQTHISQISIQTTRLVDDMLVLSEKMDSLPSGIAQPDAPVYEYHKIDLYHATDDDISQATIEFAVSESWLAEQKMTNHDVQLVRYHGGTWERLPTEYIGKKNGEYLFRAASGGFSYFATVLIRNATIVAGTPAIAESSLSAPSPAVTIAAERILPPIFSLNTEVLFAENTPGQEGPPLFLIVIGITGVFILAASGFIARTWWIRRQNPVLFRDVPFFRMRLRKNGR